MAEPSAALNLGSPVTSLFSARLSHPDLILNWMSRQSRRTEVMGQGKCCRWRKQGAFLKKLKNMVL